MFERYIATIQKWRKPRVGGARQVLAAKNESTCDDKFAGGMENIAGDVYELVVG